MPFIPVIAVSNERGFYAVLRQLAEGGDAIGREAHKNAITTGVCFSDEVVVFLFPVELHRLSDLIDLKHLKVAVLIRLPLMIGILGLHFSQGQLLGFVDIRRLDFQSKGLPKSSSEFHGIGRHGEFFLYLGASLITVASATSQSIDEALRDQALLGAALGGGARSDSRGLLPITPTTIRVPPDQPCHCPTPWVRWV